MTIGDDGIATRDNTGASWKQSPKGNYKPCKLYDEREFHDWRWIGWPLGSIIPVSVDEKWCEECGLRKRVVAGQWTEAGYCEPSAATTGDAARAAAREIRNLVYLPRGKDSYEGEVAAIIQRHFPEPHDVSESARIRATRIVTTWLSDNIDHHQFDIHPDLVTQLVDRIANSLSEPVPVEVEAAAREIAGRWVEDDLPERARLQSLSFHKLRVLAEEVIRKHCTPAVSAGPQKEDLS